MAEPKGLAALLLGSAAEGEGDAATDDAEVSDGDEKAEAARDFFTRGKAGDFKGAGEAFKRLYDMCAMSEGEEDGDDLGADDALSDDTETEADY
jgi:hypothetical protein